MNAAADVADRGDRKRPDAGRPPPIPHGSRPTHPPDQADQTSSATGIPDLSGLRLRDFTAPGAWTALEPDWRRLHATLPHANPFQSFDWFRLWVRSFAGHVSPWPLALEHAGRIVAIAPLVLWRARGRWRARVLGLPVHPDTGPLRCDFLLATDAGGTAPGRATGDPGRTRPADPAGGGTPPPAPPHDALLAALFEAIAERRCAWQELRLEGLSDISPTRGWLARHWHRLQFTAWRDSPLMPARVMVAPPDFGAWLAGATPGLRKDVRYGRNCLTHHGPVEVRVARTAPEVARAMPAVRAILTRRYACARLEQLPAADRRVIGFFEDLVADFAARDQIDLRVLLLAGAPAACVLSLVQDARVYPLLTKYDPRHRQAGPGRMVLLHLIEHAAAAGYTGIDFLSDWPYLRRFTDRTEHYWRVSAGHRGWRSRLPRLWQAWRAARQRPVPDDPAAPLAAGARA